MSAQPLVDGVGLFVVEKIGLGVDLDKLAVRLPGLFSDMDCHVEQNSDYIACKPTPLQLQLKNLHNIQFPDGRLISCRMRVWEFGAISLYFNCSFDHTLNALETIRIIPLIQSLALNNALGLFDRFRDSFADLIQRPINNNITEEWTIFYAQKSEELTVDSLFTSYSADISKLLWIDEEAASEDITNEIRSGSFARSVNDFLLIDWDCGFLASNRSAQILQVVEYALMQSLEMRSLITHLDRNLDNFLERFKSGWPIYTLGLKQLSSLSIEATWAYDRIADSLDLAGNPLLLEIYRLAAKRFRLPTLDDDIQRKMAALRDVYERVHDQNHVVIAHILEITIILLIVLEIVINLA
ncbi:MAG: hypothetical protein IT292_02290 [Deltaproteobacteria bacterium]|nr:hypothetical protein [Deltaproteobacteria bacterium]